LRCPWKRAMWRMRNSYIPSKDPLERTSVVGASDTFVWTKMGVESGEQLIQIIKRKEAERIAGQGQFWWGIGTSLGSAVRAEARAQGGTLPVLFSTMLGRAKPADESPEMILRWTGWEDENGKSQSIPAHVKVISRGDASKAKHYALVCYSKVPLALGRDGKFNPNECRTVATGKLPGSSQVTALLRGSASGHFTGPYDICFRATLIAPWAVKLVRPIPN
jgi:hypothetical protein